MPGRYGLKFVVFNEAGKVLGDTLPHERKAQLAARRFAKPERFRDRPGPIYVMRLESYATPHLVFVAEYNPDVRRVLGRELWTPAPNWTPGTARVNLPPIKNTA